MGNWKFPADGGHMERPDGVYCQTMNMTEINARLKKNDLIIIPGAALSAIVGQEIPGAMHFNFTALAYRDS